ncbi:hypothetical protein CYMTET_19640 [Cymbomonas tetramitiformis]|uniref:3'-5' exonuclease n=1 Tax=Cymbomonas tetramitiformis TaxID=36881 RepID=A0AAE0G5R3_9CHLO|nr:hypothetical protein CYMTET_19640 [Cymbomonas tetramitiformis]
MERFLIKLDKKDTTPSAKRLKASELNVEKSSPVTQTSPEDDTRFFKFGVNIQGDCSRIQRDFGVSVENVHDLITVSRRKDAQMKITNASLEGLVQSVLNRDMKKEGGARIGDWSNWPLLDTQVDYAAKDVCLAYDVLACLRERGVKLTAHKKRKTQNEPDGTTETAVKSKARKKEVAAKKENEADNIPSEAQSNFFAMMRNRSMEPPKKGHKSIPRGSSSCLQGLCFVISGVLDSMDRNECHEYIKEHGGTFTKSLTKKVTHILHDHGEIGPSKKKQAEERGIPIVGEDYLLQLVQNESSV